MIQFFKTTSGSIIAVDTVNALPDVDASALRWLFGNATQIMEQKIAGFFAGPRREMISPWSTNAVEITQNMGIHGIQRIEEFFPVSSKDAEYDPMLQRMYDGLNQEIFTVDIQPEPIKHIADIEAYNEEEGLALSPEEIEYLHIIEK